MIPTDTTSMEKKEAAMGVPKRAEKTALIPHMVMVFRSFSSNLKSLPTFCPREPPICRAAPSRPTEAPERWEKIVERNISNERRRGITSPEWMASRTRFVPMAFWKPMRR